MTNEEKIQFWQQHLTRCAESGLSQQQYYQQNGLVASTLSGWRKRLQPLAAQQSEPAIPAKGKFQAITRPAELPSLIRLSAGGVLLEVPVELLDNVLPLVATYLSGKSSC